MAADLDTIFIDTGAVRFEVATAGPQESKRLALFLHGFPELNYSWRHQMPVFAQHGYKVWAPNQRGYGKTTRFRAASMYAIEHLVDDVERLVQASGCDSVTLIAHDWGAVPAWFCALQQKPWLEQMVIMNLPHPTLMQRALRHWKQIRKSWYVAFFQIPRLPEMVLAARNAQAIADVFRNMAIDKSRFPDEELDIYRQAALQPGALRAMVNWYRGGRHWSAASRALIAAPPTITCPVLMLWGEEDIALGKELTYGTSDLVPNLTLRYLPGVSHWVQQEAPEQVNQMMDEWLRGQQVSGNRT